MKGPTEIEQSSSHRNEGLIRINLMVKQMMWQCANDNRSFIRIETFIQIMSKLDKELWVHVKSWPMPWFIVVGSLECVEQYELDSSPCCQEIGDESDRATNDSVQRRELKAKRRQKCLRFHNNLHKRFRVRHRKQDRLVTRSPGCGSLAKCGNTNLEGVQLQPGNHLKNCFSHPDCSNSTCFSSLES